MNHPLLYEINTRCWLAELSEKRGKKVSLANVPENEFENWENLGFTHIWLMGIWTTGGKSRAESLKHPTLLAQFDEVLPGWTKDDVAGSPYSIAEYRVPKKLGGENGLEKFRETLHAHGMKLILDFVPNHMGLDHPWLSEHPEYFVHSETERPETFRQETSAGVLWIACGKDPYFPAWTDVAQLEYRNPATRIAMIAELQSVAARCDGVRCDMSMLLLNEIFPRTWEHFPSSYQASASEFWTDAIQAVKQNAPEFLFLAEAYWGLEGKLQSLGFDFTYDKRLYDLLVERHWIDAARHITDSSAEYIARSAHFLENHDEPRVAPKLLLAEHRVAALTILGLPGMRFLQDGQLSGSRIRPPVQLGRCPTEPAVKEITELYKKLLGAALESAVGRGQGKVLRPNEAWSENPSHQNFVLVQWQMSPKEFDLAVVNLAPHLSQCYAPLNAERLADFRWRMSDRLSEETHEREGKDLQERGLYLELPAHGAQIFHFTPISATY
jgi:hypothetical protein